jgi:hypothetical protein
MIGRSPPSARVFFPNTTAHCCSPPHMRPRPAPSIAAVHGSSYAPLLALCHEEG